MNFAFVRATSLAILAGGLLMPISALAAPASDSGTGSITGAVTCGPNEDSPASHIVVNAAGTDLQTLTDGSGHFTMSLPAGQSFNINAMSDPQGSLVTSRYDVTVQSGQTLDIGSMDLGVCGQPVQAQPTPTMDVQGNPPADFSQD